jgi:hypothetical protein
MGCKTLKKNPEHTLKKRYIIIISLIIIGLSFWLGMRVEREFTKWDETFKPEYKIESIYFPEKKESIYLKRKTWGITGNHQTTSISTKKELQFETDTISDYVFKGFSNIIFKAEKNKLIIYSHHKPEIPLKFESEIKIELREYENNTEWNNLKKKANSSYKIFE